MSKGWTVGVDPAQCVTLALAELFTEIGVLGELGPKELGVGGSGGCGIAGPADPLADDDAAVSYSVPMGTSPSASSGIRGGLERLRRSRPSHPGCAPYSASALSAFCSSPMMFCILTFWRRVMNNVANILKPMTMPMSIASPVM